jgi:hypothetical protein
MKVTYARSGLFPKRDAMALLLMVIALLAGLLASHFISRTELTMTSKQVALNLSTVDKDIFEKRGVVMCAFNIETSRLAWTQVRNSI